ncbi:sterol desaturase family protein [Aurantiacibacter marinus]|uniref:sterol desaturase family protein n=1 Tax=Aurantiacibacter marinus TaxID=874156 RepID=UPI0009E4DB1F|nr:sterol desaturase family protein [Aurantiacibacter marinus]
MNIAPNITLNIAPDITLNQLPLIGLCIVGTAFFVFLAVQISAPVRGYVLPRGRRRLTNLSLFFIDTAAIRLLLPLALVGAAVLAQERGWGLFNVLEAPAWLAFTATLLVLDLALYVQHWATHRVPLLWRLHRVHHTDRDFDVTTAARFHPAEILLSMAYKCAVVIALGAPVMAVFVFEVGFAVATLFTHANFALPARMDKMVRKLIVTPDMHRIHHSARMVETNSNYGTTLSLWDRLFGTYRALPHDPQAQMTIGLEEWQDERPAQLGFALKQPFIGK